MSSKQTQINKFTEGINTDLHPLTAPDNLLSDCVNGTVITYNGNEYILQNDMGNYKLANAQLPINHVPIGIKEYGGIIYIVSYNPVDNLTEVGCYPSPQTLSETEQQTPDGVGFITLQDRLTNYTSLISKSILQLYSSDQDFFLNPGDKYYIHFDTNNNKDYQTLEFYVISEDKDTFKIDDRLIKTHASSRGDDQDFDTVSWSTSGWLAYKFRLASFEGFNLYVTNISYPPFIALNDKVKIDFNVRGQLVSSDILFDNPKLRERLAIWVTAGSINADGQKKYKTTKPRAIEEQTTDSLAYVLNSVVPLEEGGEASAISEDITDPITYPITEPITDDITHDIDDVPTSEVTEPIETEDITEPIETEDITEPITEDITHDIDDIPSSDITDDLESGTNDIETDPPRPLYQEFALTINGKEVWGNLLPIDSIDYSSVNKFMYTARVSSKSRLGSTLALESDGSSRYFFVEAVPILLHAEEGKHIIYDNYVSTTTIDLFATADVDKLQAMDQYKYTVDDEGVTLMFNIQSPSPNMSGVETYINIYRPAKKEEKDPNSDLVTTYLDLGDPILQRSLSEITYVGQNILTINWNKTQQFTKENAYILELKIQWNEGKNSKSWFKNLMATEVMNLFYGDYDDFSQVPLDEILKKAEAYIQWKNPTLTYDSWSTELYVNEAENDNYKFSLNGDYSKYPIKHELSYEFNLDHQPSGGIKYIDHYNLEVPSQPSLFGKTDNDNLWSNLLNNWSVKYYSGDKEFATYDANRSQLDVSFVQKYTIPMVIESANLYKYERIYLYDYMWFFNTKARAKKIKYTSADDDYINTYWYQMRYSIEPQFSSYEEKVFRPAMQTYQYYGDFSAISENDWDDYKTNAAKAIKWWGNGGFIENTDNRTKKHINSTSASLKAEWDLTSQQGESMHVANYVIPWRTTTKTFTHKTVDAIGRSYTFQEGPFFTNFAKEASLPGDEAYARVRGPHPYSGFAWLYLAGVGEQIWESQLGLGKFNARIWEKNSFIYHGYPYTYYEEGHEHYDLWTTLEGGPKRPPSPDPLLIMTKGLGNSFEVPEGDAGPREHSRLEAINVGLGEFFPMYSGIPTYYKNEFPHIEAGNAPAWIISLWGIRMPIKVEGAWRWATLPLTDIGDTPSISLWIDNSNGYLSEEDKDLAPTKGTIVPRADLDGTALENYEIAKGNDFSNLAEVPGWRNDGQSSAYLREIMTRAAILSTHIYTVQPDAVTQQMKLSKAKKLEYEENLKFTKISIQQQVTGNISSWTIYGIKVYRDTQIDPLEVKLKETKIDIDLSNITATLSDINYRNDKNLTGKEFEPKTTPSTWRLSEEAGGLGIEDIEKRVSNMYQSLLNRYNVLLEEGTAEKVAGTVYHDIKECDYDDAGLRQYFDSIVDNKILLYDQSTHRFYINESARNQKGITYAIRGRATWMYGKSGTEFDKAYTLSDKVIGYLTPNFGLPPHTDTLSLSSEFIDSTNDK